MFQTLGEDQFFSPDLLSCFTQLLLTSQGIMSTTTNFTVRRCITQFFNLLYLPIIASIKHSQTLLARGFFSRIIQVPPPALASSSQRGFMSLLNILMSLGFSSLGLFIQLMGRRVSQFYKNVYFSRVFCHPL